MTRYKYAVSSTPLPLHLVPELANRYSEHGWEYVDALLWPNVMAAPSKITLPDQQSQTGIPCYTVMVRKETPANADTVELPPNITL